MPRPMKHSGVEWLGDIPADWKIGRVSRFFDIQLGKMLQPEANDANDTLENYLCAANLGGNKLKLDTLRQMWFSTSDKKKFDVRKGDLLVVEGGDVASCDIVNEDIQGVYIQNALHRVRSSTGFDVRLLRYLLIIAKAQGHIDLICNKATIAHFTKEKFASIPFPVPPPDEQQRIASFLDDKCARIDSVIEKTRASVEEYKKLKQAIITRAVTKGIRPNRLMKDSSIEWLGQIPADWELKKLKYISRFMQTKYSKQDGQLNYVGLENIVSWSGAFVKTDSAYDRDQSLICEAGDILFGKLRPYLAKVHLSASKQCCSSEFAVIRMADSQSKRFFCYQLLSHGFIFTVDSSTYGTKMPRANAEFIKNMSLVVPPLDEQKEIAAYLDEKTAAIDSLIAKKNQLMSELESLKKSLIFEYVTGKKEVI